IKYSIIPQHLNDKELVSGNALVEMGTFLAILLGSIAGVVLKMEGTGEWVAPTAVIVIATMGFLAARQIPAAAPAEPSLKLDWNLCCVTGCSLGIACDVHSVWISVPCIS